MPFYARGEVGLATELSPPTTAAISNAMAVDAAIGNVSLMDPQAMLLLLVALDSPKQVLTTVTNFEAEYVPHVSCWTPGFV